MKQKNINPILALMLLSGLWGIIYTHWVSSPSPVSAHESLSELNIPLGAPPPPVAQNDTYAVDKNGTLTVAATGVLANDFDQNGDPLTAEQVSNPANGTLTFNADGSFTYTPNNNFSGIDTFNYNVVAAGDKSQATVTIYVRSIVFREDTNEITEGQCVEFSWLIRGDIDYVEFEVFDDNKNPYIVSQPSGTRDECPIKNTRYQLIVRWLDGTSDKDEKIDIKVEKASSSSSSSSSGSGSSNEVVVEGTIAPVGPFFLVTPVLITNAPGLAIVPTVAATPVPQAAGIAAPRPTGALESVNVLPETGSLPSFSETPMPRQAVIQPEAISITAQPHNSDKLWLKPVFGMGMLLGTILVGLTLLARFLRPPD